LFVTTFRYAIVRAAVVLAALGGCSALPTGTPDANTPGWTGRTIVPGCSSTLSGDAAATEDQQKWPFVPERERSLD
jgi:hypothetical protein